VVGRTVVGALDVAHREGVVGPVDHLDPVASANRSTKAASPIRMPSLKHGMRGSVARRTTSPIRHRSPTTAAAGSMPSIVRFSPNVPGPTGVSSCSAHQSASATEYA
jgi:hypothetical protein